MKLNAAYIRVSGRQTGDRCKQEESLPKQREMLSAWFRTLQISGELVFYEDDCSGSEISRPGLSKLIADIEADEIGNLLMYDDSRVARKQALAQAIWTLCFQHDVAVWSHWFKRRLDLGGFQDKTLLTTTAYLNEMFLRQIRRQCADGFNRLQARGCWVWGRAPFGYQRGADKHLQILESEGDAVRRIFDEAGTKGLRVIASGLEADRLAGKICSPRERPCPWTWTVVKKVLVNPVYTGATFWNRTLNLKRLPPSEWKSFHNAHPALVSRERFDEVQKLVRGRWRGPTFNRKKANDVVGVAFCGHHERMMLSGRDRYEPTFNFTCSTLGCPNNPIPAHLVRDALIRDPRYVASSSQGPSTTEDASLAVSTGTEADSSEVKAQIAKLENQRRKMIGKFAAGEWTKETLERESAPLKSQVQELKNTLAGIESGQRPRSAPLQPPRRAAPIGEWLGVTGSHVAKRSGRPRLRVYIYERRRFEVREAS